MVTTFLTILLREKINTSEEATTLNNISNRQTKKKGYNNVIAFFIYRVGTDYSAAASSVVASTAFLERRVRVFLGAAVLAMFSS
jgi:uncharacterized protein YheU (UPF0270 family)